MRETQTHKVQGAQKLGIRQSKAPEYLYVVCLKLHAHGLWTGWLFGSWVLLVAVRM